MATLLVLLIGIPSALLVTFQESLVFFPKKLSADYKFSFKTPYEEVYIPVGKEKVHGLLFQGAPTKGVVLYFHGNAGALDSWGYFGEEFVKQTGWSILIVDYLGYGKSSGKIKSEDQFYEMGQNIWDWLRRRESKPLVVYGRSLGTAVATYVAGQNHPDGLILETPFKSGEVWAKDAMKWVPSFFIRYKFPNDQWLEEYKKPVLLLHGTQDEVIPYKNSQNLMPSAPPGSELVTIELGQHNNLPSFELYWQSLKKYLK